MAKNITIELTNEVAYNFINNSSKELFVEQLPAQRVDILLPNYLTNRETILRDIQPTLALANKQQAKLINEMIDDYCASKVLIKLNQLEHGITVSAESTYSKAVMNKGLLIKFTYTTGIVIVESNDLTQDTDLSYAIAYKMLGIVSGIVNHLNKPTTVKTVEGRKIPKTNKKGAKKGKSGVKYVYKTVYKVTGINEAPQNKRAPYSEREWTKEEWTRKGHFRVYKDKETGEVIKRVWVKPATCRAKGKIKENQTLKITKLD